VPVGGHLLEFAFHALRPQPPKAVEGSNLSLEELRIGKNAIKVLCAPAEAGAHDALIAESPRKCLERPLLRSADHPAVPGEHTQKYFAGGDIGGGSGAWFPHGDG
jgi:hypothetical protein